MLMSPPSAQQRQAPVAPAPAPAQTPSVAPAPRAPVKRVAGELDAAPGPKRVRGNGRSTLEKAKKEEQQRAADNAGADHKLLSLAGKFTAKSTQLCFKKEVQTLLSSKTFLSAVETGALGWPALVLEFLQLVDPKLSAADIGRLNILDKAVCRLAFEGDRKLAAVLVVLTSAKESPDRTVESAAQGFEGQGSTSYAMGALVTGLDKNNTRVIVTNLALEPNPFQQRAGSVGSWHENSLLAPERSLSAALIGLLLNVVVARGAKLTGVAVMSDPSRSLLLNPDLCGADAAKQLGEVYGVQAKVLHGMHVLRFYGQYHPSGNGAFPGSGGQASTLFLAVLRLLGGDKARFDTVASAMEAGARAVMKVAEQALEEAPALPPASSSLMPQGQGDEQDMLQPLLRRHIKVLLLRFLCNCLSQTARELVKNENISGADLVIMRGASTSR
jgi:hypothetical protein